VSRASRCALVNAGAGAWAFEEHAERLARALWLDVSETPRDYSYLLGWDGTDPPPGRLFIPFEAILLASDKRLLAAAFRRHGVATPETHLLDTEAEVEVLVSRERDRAWALKWPTGCGGAGHRLLAAGVPLPGGWPRPYVVQEFVRQETAEVFRLYGVAGETFGWNVRRFPPGIPPSPWVAHARGARYEAAGGAPAEAESVARDALAATGLLASFGCVDLLRSAAGRWLVLEVGTDGVFNHVDRDTGLPGLAEEIDARIAAAFWAPFSEKPWESGPWRPRSGAGL
jgi:glutathione synthase/RimK-type ligase-like ATP-grasp enzyme